MSKYLTSRAAVVLITGLLTTNAIAQEVSQEHLEAAKAALKAGGSTTSLDNILPNMAQRMTGQLVLSQPHLESEISDVVTEAAIEMAPRRGDLENEVARLYAEVFTKEELDELAAFYQTEAGQKLLNRSPALIREVQKASRTWTAGVDRDLRASIAEKMQKLNAASTEAPEKTENSN